MPEKRTMGNAGPDQQGTLVELMIVDTAFSKVRYTGGKDAGWDHDGHCQKHKGGLPWQWPTRQDDVNVQPYSLEYLQTLLQWLHIFILVIYFNGVYLSKIGRSSSEEERTRKKDGKMVNQWIIQCSAYHPRIMQHTYIILSILLCHFSCFSIL